MHWQLLPVVTYLPFTLSKNIKREREHVILLAILKVRQHAFDLHVAVVAI